METVSPGGERVAISSLPGWGIDEVTGDDQPIVLVCTEGYASSLAAAALQDLGLSHATDLEGGFRAWGASGRPIVSSDHRKMP